MRYVINCAIKTIGREVRLTSSDIRSAALYGIVLGSKSYKPEKKASLKTWLVTSARNQILRDEWAAVRASIRKKDLSILPPLDKKDAGIERVDIRDLLNILTPRQRKLIEETILSGRSCSEYARIKGVSRQSINSRFNQALAKLRTVLKEDTEGEENG